MPLDASIPLQSQMPDPMASLSSLLDVSSKSLSLSKARQTFDADVARAKAESSTAQSGATVNAANIGAMIRQRTAESSTAESAATVNAANVNPLINAQAAATSTAQTGAKANQFKLTHEYTNVGLQTASGLHNDPRISNSDPATYNPNEAKQAIMEAEKQMVDKGIPPILARQLTHPFFAAADKPGDVQRMIKNTIVGNQPATAQSGTINDTGVSVDDKDSARVASTNQFGATRPGASLPGTERIYKLPLPDRQTPSVDKNGNAIVLNKDINGNIQAPTALPGTGNQSPVMTYPPGEGADSETRLKADAETARATALRAPEMHSNNAGILAALKEVIATGPLGKGLAGLAGVLGTTADRLPGGTASEKAASAYDEIGKLTEKNALAAAAAMGNETNGKIEAHLKANGSAVYNPTALRNITLLNDAMVTGSEKYALGMQKSINTSGRVFGMRQFNRDWAANANIDTLKYINAVKLKDAEEQTSLLEKSGAKGSPGRLKLVQEIKNLQKLSETGAL